MWCSSKAESTSKGVFFAVVWCYNVFMIDENLIQLVRGDDDAISVAFTNEDGSVIDITGFTIRFTVDPSKNRTDDSGVLLQKDVTAHTDAVNGETSIEISDADYGVEALKVGRYFYDIQYTDTGGKHKTPVIGVIEILEDVTKRT